MSKASDNEEFARTVQRWLGVKEDGWAGVATMSAFIEKTGQNGMRGVHGLKNPEAFFDIVRTEFGSLRQSQVDGFRTVLDFMKEWPVSWAAYGLATIWHETASTMQPIKEMGGPAYFHDMYDIEGKRPEVAKRLGNTKPGDGTRYYGRGYVQITGRSNYEKYGIADTPDDALRADVAGRILIEGMTHGTFTGKKLADYLPGDYVNARRIINHLDKAEKIAGYAQDFERALVAGGW